MRCTEKVHATRRGNEKAGQSNNERENCRKLCLDFSREYPENWCPHCGNAPVQRTCTTRTYKTQPHYNLSGLAVGNVWNGPERRLKKIEKIEESRRRAYEEKRT